MNLTDIFKGAVAASRTLVRLSQEKIDLTLVALSRAITDRKDEILKANQLDLEAYDPTNPLYDRLLLTPQRLEAIAADMIHISKLPSPVGEVMDSWERPNGMQITKRRVPFGVIGVIYESRPNVSFDVFALCFKSSNSCILKGGSDAKNSNKAIAALIREVLEKEGIDPRVITLLPSEREATTALLGAVGYVDLIIPRGGRSLIEYVRDNSRVPVIETGAGVCHTYIDKYADPVIATKVIENAKTRRVSVCNALDCIVVHKQMLENLAEICQPLAQKEVEIFADPESFKALEKSYPKELLKISNPTHYGKEFLDLKLSIKTVDTLDQALEQITENTSGHSEAIITQDQSRAEDFCTIIDAAALYVNVSTAFTDGGQYGFGAEIGISTQKLHARGPMALAELTTYKYIVKGEGQIRD